MVIHLHCFMFLHKLNDFKNINTCPFSKAFYLPIIRGDWFTIANREKEIDTDQNLMPDTSICFVLISPFVHNSVFYDMKSYLLFSVWNIYVKWKQTENKNALKECLLTKTLKYSVIFIWHAHDTIDHKQDNQGNSVPGLGILNFHSFPDDKYICLSFSVQITYWELKYEDIYWLNKEFD